MPLMSLKKFEFHGYSSEKSVSLRKSKALYISNSVLSRYFENYKKLKFVKIFVDDKKNDIGMKFSERKMESSFKLTKEATGVRIRFNRVIHLMGFKEDNQRKKFPYRYEDDLLIIHIPAKMIKQNHYIEK